MTRRLYLIDPPLAPAWAPFGISRPAAELRAASRPIRAWWEQACETATDTIFAAPHLHPFPEPGVPNLAPPADVIGPAVVARSDFVPTSAPASWPEQGGVLVDGDAGEVVAWIVPAGVRWHPDDSGSSQEQVGVTGHLLRGTFDLITCLETLLVTDLTERAQTGTGRPPPPGVTSFGHARDICLRDAEVEAGAVLDARSGPIIIEAGAVVRSDSRLEGPLWLGPGASALGGAISHCVIGPQCNARGEMSSSVMLGFANKRHDGFVGHSVIGHWANLGANTVTSNLKNTYGEIDLEVEGSRIVTGRMFVGALMGDHAKTAIGTLLGTGTVVGCGANVFGSIRPPRYVPPFAWGTGDVMTEAGFVKVARRVLPRRRVVVDAAMIDYLTRVYRVAHPAS